MDYFLEKTCFLLIVLISLKCQLVLGQNRIIGGEETVISKFPYMLRLVMDKTSGGVPSFCCAIIIGKNWALTAAHCFDEPEIDYNKIKVIAGSTNMVQLEKSAQEHKVLKVIKHNLYKGIKSKSSIGADIAVLKVSPSFTYNKVVQPLKLPEKGKSLKKNIATVSGWGRTSPGGQSQAKLRYVSVPKVDVKKCWNEYRFGRMKLRKGEICYGVNTRRIVKDKCQGDSGGPLVNSDKIIIGIVSWGVDCGTKGYPGVYTDVLYFREWIKTQTGI